MPLRRSGTVPIAGIWYDPGSAAHRKSAALRPGNETAYAAAAIDFKNPSISACRLVVDSDNCFADDNS